MNTFGWIIFCLLASAGVVQAAWWIICGICRPAESGGVYQIIKLQRDPEQLEAQLRYELLLQRWGAGWRSCATILLDTGLEEEARDICRNLLTGASGVVVCSLDELPDLIKSK